ncbi:hypothetical protein FEP39_05792 [Burkholderia multivorans]|nr:hypothetical protein [Burkholderia multivorans]MDR9060638.1 hypothetical protein [Burkholderia multivorans]MDR9066636.1 hypothetical protein [Burkholderia multivorans]MDR9072527.1 hypothetical protein [Burkholderia multivorans]MDR9078417.1 hypothetical protein [Burkholderia multivorans]
MSLVCRLSGHALSNVPSISRSLLNPPHHALRILIIPLFIGSALYHVRIASRWWSGVGCKIRCIGISNYNLHAISWEKNRPHTRCLTGDIGFNSNILGLVPTRRLLVLFVDQPPDRQPEVRLPFSRVACAAAFLTSSRGSTTLSHRHNVRPTPANTRSLRPRNRERVDVPLRVIQRPRTAAAQFDTFRRLDLRRLILTQTSASRDKHQQDHKNPTQSICCHSIPLSLENYTHASARCAIFPTASLRFLASKRHIIRKLHFPGLPVYLNTSAVPLRAAFIKHSIQIFFGARSTAWLKGPGSW